MSYLKCKHCEHKNGAKPFNFEDTTATTTNSSAADKRLQQAGVYST